MSLCIFVYFFKKLIYNLFIMTCTFDKQVLVCIELFIFYQLLATVRETVCPLYAVSVIHCYLTVRLYVYDRFMTD